MKRTVKRIKKLRRFTEDFKKQAVRNFESGEFSVLDISRLHKIHPQLIYNWIYKYSTVNEKGYRVVEMKESSDKKVKDLEKKIKELEQIIGRKQIKIDYYEKMIEIASKDFDIEIKKNSDTPQSTGFVSTPKK